jgi:RNA polymerase sigma-70 factor (ECF subfamily)
VTDHGLTGDAILTPDLLGADTPLGAGPGRLHATARTMLTSAVGNDNGYARTRNRPTNEAAARHQPGANTRTPGGRFGPGRQATPAGAPDARDEETRVLPRPEEATQVITAVPETARTGPPGPSQRPAGPLRDRPDPTVAAAEVFRLVERAQAGETEAFGLIYDRYFDTVFRFVYFRVGNRPLAEDLTSETFLRALKRIGSFTWQGRDLGAWLVTIARNLVADHFKSGRCRLEVTTGDALDADRGERGSAGSPEAAVVGHLTNVALLTAVKQLNPEQQECIVLRFLLGFSVAETAHSMGKNEGAIKALQYRAARALGRLLPTGFES